jgi:DNA-binding NarL/FixJ family response regulator
MSRKITLVLVDDHPMVREGLVVQLNSEPDMVVLGNCADGSTAIDLVDRHRPDVVLMDIDLPGISCFTSAKSILDQMPDTRIIFLSAYRYDRFIDQALKVPAWGYVTKGESFATVSQAIRTVVEGRLFFSQDVKSRLVAFVDEPDAPRPSRTRLMTLTVRELEVLRYLAEGNTVRQVAAILHRSPRTIDNHKARIMAKLDIHDKVELTRFAVREGIASV